MAVRGAAARGAAARTARRGDAEGVRCGSADELGLAGELHAHAGVRDLISLVLQVFTDPSTLDRMPVAPTSAATGTSSLHLSAVGDECGRCGLVSIEAALLGRVGALVLLHSQLNGRREPGRLIA